MSRMLPNPTMLLSINKQYRHMVTRDVYTIIDFPEVRIRSKEWEPGVTYSRIIDKEDRHFTTTQEDFQSRFIEANLEKTS